MLDEHLNARWIGRRGSIDWPARSPDLTICEYFLWSYLRFRVYQPVGIIFPSIEALRTRIEEEMSAI